MWIVCGIVSIVNKSEDGIIAALFGSAGLGLGYALVHHIIGGN